MALAVAGVALSDGIAAAQGSSPGVAWPLWMHVVVTPWVAFSGIALACWPMAPLAITRVSACVGLAGCALGLAGIAGVWFQPIAVGTTPWSVWYALRMTIVPVVGVWIAFLGAAWWLMIGDPERYLRRFGHVAPGLARRGVTRAAGGAVLIYAAAFLWDPALQALVSLRQHGTPGVPWDGCIHLALGVSMAFSGSRLLRDAPLSRRWIRGHLIVAAVACLATPWAYLRTFALEVAGDWRPISDLPVYIGRGAHRLSPIAICVVWCWLGWRGGAALPRDDEPSE